MAQVGENAVAEIQADAGGPLFSAPVEAGVAFLKNPGQVLGAMPIPVSRTTSRPSRYLHGNGAPGRILDGIGQKLLQTKGQPFFVW